MTFVEHFPIENLRPAPYNPRTIDDDAVDALRASIRLTGGIAKPLIATSEGLIVAGHQRSNAARLENMSTVPVFVLGSRFNTADEVRFNQLHNGTDVDSHRAVVKLPPGPLGYSDVSASEIRLSDRLPGASLRKEICELIMKHGQWGGVVATEDGRVLSGPQYAISCVALSVPCRVYRVRDDIADGVSRFFDRQYGQFDYSKLARDTWRQTFAQPYRCRDGEPGETKRKQGSDLYEKHLLKFATKATRILDFGCGQADYVKKLRAEGYRIQGIEFFYRNGTMGIDTAATRAMIDAALSDYAIHGPFDAVLCDYVLNSVDSPQAEADVLTCLNAFAKHGAPVFMTAREPMDNPDGERAMGMVRHVEFIDKNGFTAIHTRGGWFFQRRHSREELKRIAVEYFGDDSATVATHGATCLRLVARKQTNLPADQIELALRREFDLPWPKGSVGRAEQAVNAWRSAQKVYAGQDQR